MNINKIKIKKFGIISVSVLSVIYVTFLLLPIFINGIIESNLPEINKIVKDSTGLNSQIEGIKLVTTPKFTVGANISAIKMNNGTENVLEVKNAKARLSLLPILLRKIELDIIEADSIFLNLRIEKDGSFELINNIPTPVEEPVASEQVNAVKTSSAVTELPFGIKLSNKLPNIKSGNYTIKFTDIPTDKHYEIIGDNLQITDFIFNKKINIKTAGKINLDGQNQFNYDVKVLNRVMPDIDLHTLVFTPQVANETPTVKSAPINITDVFKAIKSNKITANLNCDLKTELHDKDIHIDGLTKLDNISIAVDGTPLPSSFIKIDFKHSAIDFDSDFFTSKTDKTEIVGNLKTGKKPNLNLTFNSNAKFNDLINLIDSVAKTVGINEFDTLSASGGIDANFNLQSDFKKVTSNGYFDIKNSNLKYGLYNVSVDKINANIDFSDNQIKISDSGFEVMSQPLKFYGEIKQDTTSDLHLIADKLPIKGLLLAFGQIALLKDNDVKSGTISMDASVLGRLINPNIKVNISADNIDITNIPADIRFTNKNSVVDILPQNNSLSGKISINNVKVINPLLNINLPKSTIDLDEKDIVINDSQIFIENNKFNFGGKITNYLTNNLSIDFKAYTNKIENPVLTLKGGIDDLLNGKPKFNNLTLKTFENLAIEIPLFKESKATAISDVSVNGNIATPAITGTMNLPLISIPTIKTNIKNTKITLDSNVINVKCPNIVIDNSVMSGEAKISTDFSKGIYIPALTFNANNIDVDTLATAMINLPQPTSSSANLSSSTSSVPQDLGITLVNGKGNISKMKSGGIVATDLSSDFYLKNNTLYLNNIKGKAFEGDIAGKVSYNIITSAIGVDMSGENLNATSAIEGAAGIKNALSGRLKFGADITLKGLTEKEMMESLNGKVTFGIGEGSLGSIGRLDNFIGAQNVTSNSILKAAINSVAVLPTIQKTANFKSINGEIDLAKGWANLKSVTLSGPAMCYYVSGKYNLLSGDTKITILGRLSSDVVAALGPLGELSVDKLTAYIPKFGALTSVLLSSLTTPPSGEKTEFIPNLTNGDTVYKDFKVLIDGNIASPNAIKYFKWLSVCDTSGIETINMKEQIQTTQKAIKDSYANTVQETKNAIDAAKQEAKNQVEQLKNLKNNFGNILKSF